MDKKLDKMAWLPCCGRFRRNSLRKKSVERAELSCHMSYDPIVSGLGPEDLLPEEWIDVARKARVRTIAIANFQGEMFEMTAQAVEKLRRELGPEALDFKVLYGLETVLEDGSLVHLLAWCQEGVPQLYRLIEIAWTGREDRPFLQKEEIGAHRTGLLVGSPGEGGELCRGILEVLDDTRLTEIARFYDYLSVLTPQHYQLLSTRALAAEDLVLKTIALGKQAGKPVIASGNMRTANQDWDMFRSSIAYGIRKKEDGDLDAPLPDLLYTEELLNAFSFLEKELAEEIVIYAPNRLADRCEEIRIFPEDKRHFLPILPDAFQTVADLCREQLRIRYNGKIPETVLERLEYELPVLKNNELLCSILLISSHLVQRLQERGYPVRVRTHNAAFVHACSYVAYLLGATEVNPLPMHIPGEPFRELDTPDLEFGLNVPRECLDKCWEDIIEIFLTLFPRGMAVSYGYGGGVGWTQRVSPSYRRILVPDATELQNWMALRKIDGGYMIPYRSPEEFPDMFRLVLFPARNLSLLRRLEELTGVPQSSINVEETVPLLLRDQTDIPGCDLLVWKLASPKTMDDIIKVFALSSPLDLRGDDWETLVQNGTVPFSEIIGSQDDIFCHLLDAGLDCEFAYRIAEDVSRGRGLDEEITAVLMENGIQEWFIHSCNEIVALWPKAVVAETKVIPAIRAAWYKAHFSKEYAQVYFEVYAQ